MISAHIAKRFWPTRSRLIGYCCAVLLCVMLHAHAAVSPQRAGYWLVEGCCDVRAAPTVACMLEKHLRSFFFFFFISASSLYFIFLFLRIHFLSRFVRLFFTFKSLFIYTCLKFMFFLYICACFLLFWLYECLLAVVQWTFISFSSNLFSPYFLFLY